MPRGSMRPRCVVHRTTRRHAFAHPPARSTRRRPALGRRSGRDPQHDRRRCDGPAVARRVVAGHRSQQCRGAGRRAGPGPGDAARGARAARRDGSQSHAARDHPRGARDARPVLHRHLPAGLPGDRAVARRVRAAGAADDDRVHARVRRDDPVARRAVRRARPAHRDPGLAGGLRRRVVRLRVGALDPVPVGLPHPAGPVGRGRHRRRARDRARPVRRGRRPRSCCRW